MFTAQVVIQYWPTGWVWLFQVDAVTGGTVGTMRVQGDHGTGYETREGAERAGLRAASSAGWTAPRVVHC